MNLERLRTEKNLTQQALADKVGVTRQMIGAIENGANPSITTAKRLAEVLDCSIDTLLSNATDLPT